MTGSRILASSKRSHLSNLSHARDRLAYPLVVLPCTVCYVFESQWALTVVQDSENGLPLG